MSRARKPHSDTQTRIIEWNKAPKVNVYVRFPHEVVESEWMRRNDYAVATLLEGPIRAATNALWEDYRIREYSRYTLEQAGPEEMVPSFARRKLDKDFWNYRAFLQSTGEEVDVDKPATAYMEHGQERLELYLMEVHQQ